MRACALPVWIMAIAACGGRWGRVADGSLEWRGRDVRGRYAAEEKEKVCSTMLESSDKESRTWGPCTLHTRVLMIGRAKRGRGSAIDVTRKL